MRRATVRTKARILIVEDDRDVAVVMTLALEDRFDVVVAENLDCAKQALASEVPDLVLLDWRVGTRSGQEFLDQLERLPKRERPHVVVTTGDIDDERLDRAVARREVCLLSKPFELRELLELVTRLLK